MTTVTLLRRRFIVSKEGDSLFPVVFVVEKHGWWGGGYVALLVGFNPTYVYERRFCKSFSEELSRAGNGKVKYRIDEDIMELSPFRSKVLLEVSTVWRSYVTKKFYFLLTKDDIKMVSRREVNRLLKTLNLKEI